MIVVPEFGQIVVEPLIVTVGNGLIAIVVEPVTFWLQVIGLFNVVLTRLYVVDIVKAPVSILAFPVVSKVTVWLAPPFIV